MVYRQLDLLKGPRQKGTVLRGPTEFEIHCVIADYLRAGLSSKWVWFHPPNGGERSANFVNGKRVSFEGGRLKRMGARPGVSDIVLFAPPQAQAHVLEIKRKGETPSDAQYAFMNETEMSGGVAAWVDNVDDALAVLRRWGAVKSTIK